MDVNIVFNSMIIIYENQSLFSSAVFYFYISFMNIYNYHNILLGLLQLPYFFVSCLFNIYIQI